MIGNGRDLVIQVKKYIKASVPVNTVYDIIVNNILYDLESNKQYWIGNNINYSRIIKQYEQMLEDFREYVKKDASGKEKIEKIETLLNQLKPSE